MDSANQSYVLRKQRQRDARLQRRLPQSTLPLGRVAPKQTLYSAAGRLLTARSN